MSDQRMTDTELINYCEAQARTPVGMIDGERVARLHELAGLSWRAPKARVRQFWQPEQSWVDSLVSQARARQDRWGDAS